MPHRTSKSGGRPRDGRTRSIVVVLDLALSLLCALGALVTFIQYGAHGLPAHVFGFPWWASFILGSVLFLGTAWLTRRTPRLWIAAQILTPLTLLLALTSVAVT